MTLEGRGAIGYDHGYDAQAYYMGLALDKRYVEGFVEGCLERVGEDDPDDEVFLRRLWEDGETDTVLDMLKADCQVMPGRPEL